MIVAPAKTYRNSDSEFRLSGFWALPRTSQSWQKTFMSTKSVGKFEFVATWDVFSEFKEGCFCNYFCTSWTELDKSIYFCKKTLYAERFIKLEEDCYVIFFTRKCIFWWDDFNPSKRAQRRRLSLADLPTHAPACFLISLFLFRRWQYLDLCLPLF